MTFRSLCADANPAARLAVGLRERVAHDHLLDGRRRAQKPKAYFAIAIDKGAADCPARADR